MCAISWHKSTPLMCDVVAPQTIRNLQYCDLYLQWAFIVSVTLVRQKCILILNEKWSIQCLICFNKFTLRTRRAPKSALCSFETELHLHVCLHYQTTCFAQLSHHQKPEMIPNQRLITTSVNTSIWKLILIDSATEPPGNCQHKLLPPREWWDKAKLIITLSVTFSC